MHKNAPSSLLGANLIIYKIILYSIINNMIFFCIRIASNKLHPEPDLHPWLSDNTLYYLECIVFSPFLNKIIKNPFTRADSLIASYSLNITYNKPIISKSFLLTRWRQISLLSVGSKVNMSNLFIMIYAYLISFFINFE